MKEIRRNVGPFFGAFWPFILGATFVAGGLASIALSYFGVAGTIHVGLQVPYVVSGGLLGLALVVFGSALLVLHGLGRQTRLIRRLLEEARTGGPGGSGPAERSETDQAAASNGFVLVAKGGSSFHRAECFMVRDKQTSRVRIKTATGRGLSPCRICDPVGG
jgi:hypothetical protein